MVKHGRNGEQDVYNCPAQIFLHSLRKLSTVLSPQFQQLKSGYDVPKQALSHSSHSPYYYC